MKGGNPTVDVKELYILLLLYNFDFGSLDSGTGTINTEHPGSGRKRRATEITAPNYHHQTRSPTL
jgi:hypothetical protein